MFNSFITNLQYADYFHKIRITYHMNMIALNILEFAEKLTSYIIHLTSQLVAR